VAKSQLGVKEVGTTNTGVEVDQYLASVGIEPGHAWCAAFVYWCFDKAARTVGVPNPLPKTGYCPNIESWAKDRGILVPTPQAGDIFLVRRVPAGERHVRACHTGIVTRVTGGKVKTVEGNTNDTGSANGIGVFALNRTVTGKIEFVRVADAFSNAVAKPRPKFVGVTLRGEPLGIDAILLGGHSMLPVRAIAEKLDHQVAWDNEDQTVLIDGKPLGVDISPMAGKDGERRAYALARELAAALKLHINWDDANAVVQLT